MPNPRRETSPVRLFPRHVRTAVLEALDDTRVVLVMGARQVGKSTLAEHIAIHDHPRQRMTLDAKGTRDAAIADPESFIADLTGPVLIDEVQRAPELLLAIKASVDRDQRPGRFLLTGSANILTAPRVLDALTGRIEIIELWPLSQAEIEGSDVNLVDALFSGTPPRVTGAPVGRVAFVDRVASGGFPQARIRTGRRRRNWFTSYLTTVFDRDLRELSDAHKLEQMPRLLRLLASQAANIYNVHGTARALGLDDRTVRAYTRLLETLFLVRRVPAWRPGIGAREVHSPKIYVTDSGLLAHLLGADDHRIASDQQVTGKVFENFVAMEVAKHRDWADVDATQYHYREGRDEIDIVLENRRGELVGIEVKAAASVGGHDTRALKRLRDRRDEAFRAGVVIYTGAQTLGLSERIWAVPVSALWLS